MLMFANVPIFVCNKIDGESEKAIVNMWCQKRLVSVAYSLVQVVNQVQKVIPSAVKCILENKRNSDSDVCSLRQFIVSF